MLSLVGLVAREQCHVVGAFDGCDAVELDEAEFANQLSEIIFGLLCGRGRAEALPMHEDAARKRVGDEFGGSALWHGNVFLAVGGNRHVSRMVMVLRT